MPRFIRFAAAAGLCALAAFGQNAAGDWRGTISASGEQVPVNFHIVSTGAAFSGTFDSPGQGLNGIPFTAVKIDHASVTVELAPAHVTFTGTLSQDGNRLSGTWTQNGATLPCNLERYTATDSGKPRRPQEPNTPFPYTSSDVAYPNPAARITLSATITLPPGKGPFPAVVLIPGSGPQDRDETVMGHKPFLVLADYLTRHGIVVLRADDRGIGKSTGSFAASTTADFATDAEASLAYLKTRPEVNGAKIGLIGHSEGGAIAPLVASRNPSVAFLVLLAAPGVRGDEVVISQIGAGARAQGVPKAQIDIALADERKILNLVEQEKDTASLQAKLAPLMDPETLRTQFNALSSPWYRYFLTFDPTVALRKVKAPVLALNGSKDTQVVASLNLPEIRKALTQAGNQHFEVEEMPGLNHLFQTAKTGALSEYAQNEETMSPVALAKIAAFVKKQ